jgi:HD-GYP domain-containing protein (c-di-GMP phosphodiesterase class II)
MLELSLQHSIQTLDQELLFPSGTVLTQETVEAMICSRKTDPYETCSLFRYGSIREDCLGFLRIPPYGTIFSGNKLIGILEFLETAHFPVPILQSLDYFKRYDVHTYAHVLMVFALSALLAKDLIPDYREYLNLSATGPTHDIGKICVPLPILKKTTPLTKAERRLIEHHAVASYVLLGYYSNDARHLSSRVALDHHERRDGSGYPRGILLQDPMVEIIAVCDIYDALVRPRPYRSGAYDNRATLEEITAMAKQNRIGWDAVKALIAHNRKSNPDYREITISAEKRGTPPSYNVYGVTAGETDSKD